MACPHAESCPLFPLFRSKSTLNVWKIHYCEAAFDKCARFQRSRAGHGVPPNMLPNGEKLNIPGA